MAETKHAHPVTVIPYLSFMGNCEEALHIYIEAFGGEILYLSRWSEETYDTTPKQIGKVMHAEFMIGNTRMAAGDTFDSERTNTAIKLMIHMDSKEDASKTISALSKGGTIISPLHAHPEPDDAGCGSITKDHFGYTWIITCPNPDKR